MIAARLACLTSLVNHFSFEIFVCFSYVLKCHFSIYQFNILKFCHVYIILIFRENIYCICQFHVWLIYCLLYIFLFLRPPFDVLNDLDQSVSKFTIWTLNLVLVINKHEKNFDFCVDQLLINQCYGYNFNFNFDKMYLYNQSITKKMLSTS